MLLFEELTPTQVKLKWDFTTGVVFNAEKERLSRNFSLRIKFWWNIQAARQLKGRFFSFRSYNGKVRSTSSADPRDYLINSCLLSDLVFEWQRGFRWPCFDTDLTAFVVKIKLF